MFSQKDLHQISLKGIKIDDINRQIKYFKSGFPPADISLPATPGRGIIFLSDGDEKHYREVFVKNAPDYRLTRFIPASGAATRMFKSLYSALENLEGKPEDDQQKWIESNQDLKEFFDNLSTYPFYEDLETSSDMTLAKILASILGEEGINYGQLPKGLLKFHKYQTDDRRSSFEEHVREAAGYCVNRGGKMQLHLTVSPDHLDGFKSEASRVIPEIEAETGLLIDISFSFQKPETDTIAVDLENQPFRNPDGSLLFRPGGHGALIQNLNELDSDLLFVSNIDNVGPDRLKGVRIHYKQVLGGLLLEIRSKIFYYLQLLHGEDRVEKTRLDSIVTFLHERLGLAVPDQLNTWDVKDLKFWLLQTMDRPLRICGMVKNEGEPGGGPFYVRSDTGEVSLQIVESSQIDLKNQEKVEILNLSTHFNPVDLVCSTRNFLGEKFNLTNYVDPATGFISIKSVGGKELKAFELPGLWNGAMANWLTLFVEVPVETFSPVKTVYDLLRDEHQV